MEELAELLKESLKSIEGALEKIDRTNKRLVTLCLVAILAFCITILGMTWTYFNTDYDYGTITQEQNVNTEE